MKTENSKGFQSLQRTLFISQTQGRWEPCENLTPLTEITFITSVYLCYSDNDKYSLNPQTTNSVNTSWCSGSSLKLWYLKLMIEKQHPANNNPKKTNKQKLLLSAADCLHLWEYVSWIQKCGAIRKLIKMKIIILVQWLSAPHLIKGL